MFFNRGSVFRENGTPIGRSSGPSSPARWWVVIFLLPGGTRREEHGTKSTAILMICRLTCPPDPRATRYESSDSHPCTPQQQSNHLSLLQCPTGHAEHAERRSCTAGVRPLLEQTQKIAAQQTVETPLRFSSAGGEGGGATELLLLLLFLDGNLGKLLLLLLLLLLPPASPLLLPPKFSCLQCPHIEASRV